MAVPMEGNFEVWSSFSMMDNFCDSTIAPSMTVECASSFSAKQNFEPKSRV